MNGKERVRNAIARKPVDKVPLGFYLVDCDTIEKVIGRKTFVRNRIGVMLALAEGRRAEVAESYKKDSVEFYRKIDCADLIIPKEAALLPPKNYEPQRLKKIADNRWEDEQGRIFQAIVEANDIMCIHDPTLKKEYTVEDFQIPPDVKPPDDSVFEALDYLIAELGEERYVCSSSGIAAMPMPGGFDTAMLTYALQPEVMHAANRRTIEMLKKTVSAHIRKGSAGVHISQDMAGTNGPFISPAMFRELCFPYLKESIAIIKRHTDQVNFHNCGMNIPLMDMFIEAGIDCYQSLQTTAGMEIGKLKKMFGDKVAFWGGIAVEVLISGTTGETRQEVRKAMERGAPGGGFILGPSHSIAYGVKYDNFLAMIDEYVKLRDKV
ncbi:MAG: uroporphyrinogen decarboxylase family protein [Kiritimatiellia bacterium]|nr:uroporphyrinogen decarboxylase family protein [Kiritimatiellia bacterium]